MGLHDASGFGTEQSSYVLNDDELRTQNVDGVCHVGPEPGAGPVRHAGAATGDGHVLAGKPAREDVDWRDGRPVDLRDVAVVRDARVVVRHDARRGIVELGVPGEVAAVHLLDGGSQSSVAGEQLTDQRGAHVVLLSVNPAMCGSGCPTGRVHRVRMIGWTCVHLMPLSSPP